MNPGADPFFIDPDDWFAVLCQGFAADKQGRFDLRQVVNQVKFETPPATSGITPHAHLKALLAIGWSRGFGNFSVKVDLRDTDGSVLWTWNQQPSMAVGPGQSPGAVFVIQVDQWFREPGVYYFNITREPSTTPARRVAFEVTPTPRAPLPPETIPEPPPGQ